MPTTARPREGKKEIQNEIQEGAMAQNEIQNETTRGGEIIMPTTAKPREGVFVFQLFDGASVTGTMVDANLLLLYISDTGMDGPDRMA